MHQDARSSATPRSAGTRWTRGLHLAIVLAGICIIGYGALMLGHGQVTCRGAVMEPGQVCRKADFAGRPSERTQSYEQRLEASRSARPLVVLVGVAIAGFGTWLLVRRPGPVDAREEALLEAEPVSTARRA